MADLGQHRAKAGLSQQDLAQLVGKSQAWISRVERGRSRPTPEEAKRLAKVLDLDQEQTAELIASARQPRPTLPATARHEVVERVRVLLRMIEDEVNRLR